MLFPELNTQFWVNSEITRFLKHAILSMYQAKEKLVAMTYDWSKLQKLLMEDVELREEIKRDPRKGLASVGIDVEDGIEIKVVEDTPTLMHFTLPPIGSDR